MFTWIRHNQGTFVAIILSALLLVWSYGCESQVKSLVSDAMVTRGELQVELKTEVQRLEAELLALQETATLRNEQLDKQDAIKAGLFDTLSVISTSGTINPAGILTSLGTLAALGLGYDNRRKDTVIKNRPLNNAINTT